MYHKRPSDTPVERRPLGPARERDLDVREGRAEVSLHRLVADQADDRRERVDRLLRLLALAGAELDVGDARERRAGAGEDVVDLEARDLLRELLVVGML